jgi:antitoxin component of RelBE/YafQ-DinJ toxin-antitoxin module
MSFKSLIAKLLQLARDQAKKLDDAAIKQGIRFADRTVDSFEGTLETKLGFQLPIDFSIEELLGDKIQNLSNKVEEKIEGRIARKKQEQEERAQRERDRYSPIANRHNEALNSIEETYQTRLEDIENGIDPFIGTPEENNNTITFNFNFKGRLVDSNDFSFAPGSTVDGDIYIIDTSRNNLILREFNIKIPFGTPRTDTTKFEFTTRLTATLDPDNDPNNPIYTNLAIAFFPTNRIAYYRNIYYLNPKDYPEYDPNTLNDQDYGDLLTYNKRDTPITSYTITNVRGESVSSIIEFSDLRRYNELDRQEDQANRIPPTPKITNRKELRELRRKAEELYSEALEEENEIWEQEKADFEANERKKNEAGYREIDVNIVTTPTIGGPINVDPQLLQPVQVQPEDEINVTSSQQIAIQGVEDKYTQAYNDIQQKLNNGDITEREANRERNKIENKKKQDLKRIDQGRPINKPREKKRDRDGKILKFDTSYLKDPTFIRLTYETTYQFLPEKTKIEISEFVNEYLGFVNTTLSFSSTLRNVLVGVQGILSTLGKTGQTLGVAGQSITTAQNAIFNLAIPTGSPIGVGLPLNVIMGLVNNLDKLRPLAEKIDGAGELIAEASIPVSDKVNKTINILDSIIDVTIIILDIINFLQYISQSGAVPIEQIQQETNDNISNLLNESGNSSSSEENTDINDDLLSRLQPNSNNPFIYKGFRLVIQYVIEETSGLTQSQIVATNSTNGVSLSTDLSFTTSHLVLVNEMIFQINNYNLIYISDPLAPPIPENLVNVDDISVDVDATIPEINIPERFTKKQIKQERRSDRREDRKDRRAERRAGDITRREARQDRKQDRKERKQQAKERRKTRIRKRER